MRAYRDELEFSVYEFSVPCMAVSDETILASDPRAHVAITSSSTGAGMAAAAGTRAAGPGGYAYGYGPSQRSRKRKYEITARIRNGN